MYLIFLNRRCNLKAKFPVLLVDGATNLLKLSQIVKGYEQLQTLGLLPGATELVDDLIDCVYKVCDCMSKCFSMKNLVGRLQFFLF